MDKTSHKPNGQRELSPLKHANWNAAYNCNAVVLNGMKADGIIPNAICYSLDTVKTKQQVDKPKANNGKMQYAM
jgi:hypothetical protein